MFLVHEMKVSHMVNGVFITDVFMDIHVTTSHITFDQLYILS